MAVNKATKYTRVYDGMAGVELGDLTEPSRFSRLENMYIDYEGGGSIPESIPGFRRVADLGETVHGIYRQKLGDGSEFLLVHAGERLLRFPTDPPSGEYEELCRLNDADSLAFCYGRAIYLIDGESMIMIRESEVVRLGEPEFSEYVPTLLKNGEAFEQRNLLTDEFRAVWEVYSADLYSYGSPCLKFRVTSELEMTCNVSGITADASGDVYIPSYARIGAKKYAVTGIDEQAFRGSAIVNLVAYPGLKRIERYAFWGCKSLQTVVLPSTVEVIYDYAFYNCNKLSSLRLGAGLLRLGTAAFAACSALLEVDYEGDEQMYSEIDDTAVLGNRIINYGIGYKKLRIALDIVPAVSEIEIVTVNGSAIEYEYDEDLRHIMISTDDSGEIEGSKIIVYARLAEHNFMPTDISDDAVQRHPGCNPRSLILGCRLAAVYDGRIFLSGNPDAPNSVFVSSLIGDSAEPIYFGSLDYFTDGVSGYPVVGLTAVRDALVTVKGGDDGSGSIFTHTAAKCDDARRRIYPVKCRLGTENGFTSSAILDGELVVVGDSGVFEVDPDGTDGRVERRRISASVATLLAEATDSSATEWLGYLAILAGDVMLLADPRATAKRGGEREYGWYPIFGVGAYKNATRVYRYADSDDKFAIKHPTLFGRPTNKVTYSYTDSDGHTVYYTNEDGVRYALIRTEEMRGGEFSPADRLLSVGKRLFFSTKSGVICVFNNDMRGVAPTHTAEDGDFDVEEYGREMKNLIHPSFYSFDSHAVRYAAATVWDNCGECGKTKDSVPGSLVMKLKCLGDSRVKCEVGTDGEYFYLGEFGCGRLGFGELDFSSLSMSGERYMHLPIREWRRGWMEKSVSVWSEDYCRPFGIAGISFDYTVKGRPKRK